MEKWTGMVKRPLRIYTNPNVTDDIYLHFSEIRDYIKKYADKVYGVTKGGKDFDRRFTLTFPSKLLLLIRTVYKPDELTFDKEFFKEFVKRYPSHHTPSSSVSLST